MTTSRNLVDSYIVILNTRETLTDVADYAEVDRSYKEMKEMIVASADAPFIISAINNRV